ncbi:MAG: hypothetical protein A2W93_14580 [Bacteroidetes bacterium GWF2_43_63]|nr:MAG: hypothetical protein A2W94_01150 [Bacteroidetes bacterium GWE2_42_42]OFY52567.1 MAG: hypothetical protein A2W93_14580 [Bacteroidetes bacterium GWF2_43_63]HBG71474.1 hypothetical protein [Bacteroidales bacterium]HCB60774.1 hypothetical protein [Bacteroidales bacterium]HCY23501.1 hypothetical protein [Bacteroidales bacterium]
MKKWLKKWYFWIPLLLVLALFLTVFLTNRSSTTLNPGEKNFAISDTATVTRVFLADKRKNSVLLERTDSNGWMLNKKYSVQPEMMEELLYTLMYVTVRNPVPKTQYDMVFKQLAGFSTKVEVYATVYRIDLMGIRLFPYEKCIRTYYVGSATMDNTGTYMMMEDAEMPFIMHIPGFRGFLEPRYSPREYDWRDHKVFRYTLASIAKVSVTYPKYADRSFELLNPDNSNFSVTNEVVGKLKNIDTVKVINYLNAFTDARFEEFLNKLPIEKQDSIRKSTPFCIISVTDRKNETNSITLYRIKLPEGSINLTGDPIEFDPERLYGVVNGKDLVMAQYFVFGSLMRYASEFAPSDNTQPVKIDKFDTLL